jgi:hypothetical protein
MNRDFNIGMGVGATTVGVVEALWYHVPEMLAIWAAYLAFMLWLNRPTSGASTS